MELEIRQEDIQSVMQANPMVALQVENQALRRKLQETAIAFDGAMSENERLGEELDQLKHGSEMFQLFGEDQPLTKEEDREANQ